MSDGVIAEYAGRLRALSEKENLFPFDRGAFAAMLEYGVRQAGRRNKVTARFVDIADLAREAHYSAAATGETIVRAHHVRLALFSKIERHNLIETRIREMIEEGTQRDRKSTRLNSSHGSISYAVFCLKKKKKKKKTDKLNKMNNN